MAATKSHVPRFLQLARAIHSRISQQEATERAAHIAAQSLAAVKNEIILRAVQEVIEFCALLRDMPELTGHLSKKTEEITQRLFSPRSDYTVQESMIEVRYEAPTYCVDMQMPDHIKPTIKGDTAYLHVHFNPVTFIMVNPEPQSKICITKSLLMKQYHLKLEEEKLYFYTYDGTPADPIADIITELRSKLGHAFFETKIMPYLEAQMVAEKS
jgi:hypothetical protein